ncbi:cysteine--tRNA ligase [Dissulfurirhabdus thermomarina]|uniref:Cysteine--tRNA ligase n=1 Tax=Dissulfurirhabdus thermomarina TaxID=1765737 RepID=A0A6N9TPK5_DISTH|nr:cysteine--tRNA ligase [Dissulfurirhabdus thermomarina]NDY43099.1 cysteine--tRNA ligase [Dissulfurirhabdus thermomarina]NMX24365.1 cysteine--tRNA ligase [Dissulfurirhabdus thermomarina]
MDIRIYNTLTRRKEPFVPLEPGRVRMYVCGITAYDRCHIGHARSAVVFDAVVRHLRRRGFEVTCVRNFTDIDDKIIRRAREEGIDTTALAEREIAHFYEDMDALGVLRADVEPRATAHIPQIIDLIRTLVEKGHAYEAGGDVYFSVRTFPSYGALSGRDLEQLRAGARVAVGERKQDPADFALWKASKPGEPAWDSPWGPGRPGWHIECSAMSMAYLGPTLDIHAGGLDLSFPHHENERAQSEAATGRPFVRYWMHNGFVTIRGEKMSKSLGNFVTIQDILRRYHPEVLRHFLLTKHYRSPLDYGPGALEESRAAVDRGYAALAQARRIAARPAGKKRPLDDETRAAAETLSRLPERFDAAMDDDFNTAQALGVLFEGVRALNRLSLAGEKRPSALLAEPLAAGAEALQAAGGVLGLFREDPAGYLRRRDIEALARVGLTEAEVEAAVRERAEARKARDWARSDAIRDALAARGVVLRDEPGGGTTWTVKEPGA